MEYYQRLFKYRRWIAGCLAGSLALNKGLCVLFPETLSIPGYADLQAERFSVEHMLNLIKNTRSDLQISEVFFPFITNQSNCVCAGHFGLSKWTKQMPIVGIPKHYFCSNIFEVEELEIKIGKPEKPVYLTGGPNEMAFLESLIFSESSQKFDIARQLFAIKGNWFLAHIVISPLFVLFGYLGCFHGVKLLFSGKPVSFKRILQWQVACLFFAWFACKLTKNAFNYFMVKSIDKNAASVSKEYALGALEFCSNLRKTNKALRVLYGKKGESLYTADGDFKDSFFLNKFEPSLSAKEKYFNAILNTFEQS